jgi:diguanylate cyclase (GGDEF)-like protein
MSTQAPRTADEGPPDGDAAPASVHEPEPFVPDAAAPAPVVPEPEEWFDHFTGIGGPRFWERILVNEEARRLRYGRPATVALVEFAGFEGDGGWLARELAVQLFADVARVLAKEVRTSDHVARIGSARFGIILIETDEVSAINFVDRVRKACWTEVGAGTGLSIRTGWASAAEAGSLEGAILRAESRMHDSAFQEAPPIARP